MEDVEDLSGTSGAVLVGGFVSASLSGVVIIQSIIYYKLFPGDAASRKLLVFVIFLMDMAHSSMVWSGIWAQLITQRRAGAEIDYIPRAFSLSIAVTAALTFLVHMFFAERIHTLNRKKWKWHLTSFIIFMATARLAFACVTSGQLIRLQSLSAFVRISSWTFTLGLALSAIIDAVVTISLFALLKKSGGKNYLHLGHIIDSLVLYTVEIGSMTCAVTIVSMVCWLAMRKNLVFLGLHFVIGKLYANSLLATLNTREHLRLTHRRMINEIDASAIVREDLQLHFRTQMMDTIREEEVTTNATAGHSESFVASRKSRENACTAQSTVMGQDLER